MHPILLIVKGLAQNISLFLALSCLYVFSSPYPKTSSKYSQDMVRGVIFAFVAGLGMLLNMEPTPHRIIDGRILIVGIAGAYGGVVAGASAVLPVVLFQSIIGGSGAVLDCLGIMGGGLTGVLFRLKFKKEEASYSSSLLLLMGLALVLQAQLWVPVLLPSDAVWDFVKRVSIPALIFYPPGTLLLGYLLNRGEYESRFRLQLRQRKQSEKALWESTERFQKMFHSQPDAIFVLSAQNPVRIQESNQAASEIFGYEAEEMIGKTVDMLYIDTLHLKDFLNQLFAAIKRDGNLRNVEFAMKRKDGTVFPSEHTVLELKNDAGARIGWVHVMRDITDRKEMEDRLQRAQRMEAIGTLAGGIAHDFNNILSPIIGMAELLLEDLTPGSPQHEDVKEIFSAGKRGSELVKQILAFSRQTKHQLVEVRLQQILKEVFKLIRSTIPKNIEISAEIDSGCGLVMADPIQMHQIAMNLITNAFHAVESSGGKIKIELKAVDLSSENLSGMSIPPGQYARLAISDTGHGIEQAFISKIFNPYFTTKEQGKGTGLGLSVVYGILKNHEGEITVESTLGEGTTFTVYLPILQLAVGSEVDFKEKIIPRGTERIMLVDDEEQIVKLEQRMLESLGYHITRRTSSIEALETFKADPGAFDLVLTDTAMPNMTGDRLARELMAIRPELPIIICTGFSERLTREKSIAMGIKGFLMKPMVKSDLARLIRKVLDESKST